MTACPDDGWSFTVEVDATYHPPSSPPTDGALALAEPADQGDLVSGVQVGEYRIEKKIGEGGMGAVYSALHPMIGKRAAIKVISSALGTDPSAVNRFVQEARSVNQIGHPNIVDVFAFGELPDGRNYFVMEYLQGESLAERIGHGAMPLGEAIEILDQVADALEAAHEKQIVHRDLKPDNVYLAAVRGGRTMVKLLDFGIAKLSLPDGPGSQGGIAKTRTGMMMGTPGYLSPEQARGKNVDHRTDVYALGCMMFEIVCGRLPFIADNAMDIVLMHMTAPAPRAREAWPEIPASLDEMIARMLEKEPSLRPSLIEIRQTLSELITSGLVTLTSGRSVAFRSGFGRLATPGHGTPSPTGSMLAAGTLQATMAPSTQPPMTGGMPVAAAHTTAPPMEAPKPRKTGLVVAVVAGLVVIGGAGAFFATKGGDKQAVAKQTDPVATAAPTPAPAPTPTPAGTPTTEPGETLKTVEAAKQPGVIEIEVNVDKASVTVDGKPVAITGRTAKASVDTEGSHTITVSAAGRDEVQKQVDVKAGGSVKVVVKLERAKVTVGTKRPPPPGSNKKPPPGTGSATSTKPVTDKNYTVDPFAN